MLGHGTAYRTSTMLGRSDGPQRLIVRPSVGSDAGKKGRGEGRRRGKLDFSVSSWDNLGGQS